MTRVQLSCGHVGWVSWVYLVWGWRGKLELECEQLRRGGPWGGSSRCGRRKVVELDEEVA